MLSTIQNTSDTTVSITGKSLFPGVCVLIGKADNKQNK